MGWQMEEKRRHAFPTYFFIVSIDIYKILNRRNIDIKRKVDSLLEMDAILYTNLGTDSTKTERSEVKKASRKIYNAIKKVDWQLGCSLLYAMDSTNEGNKT